MLALHRDGRTTHLVFRGGEGRFVPDGFLHSGCVAVRGQGTPNPHEPGVVRAFVDEAARRGLLTGAAELDGWELFLAVAAGRAADGRPGPSRPAARAGQEDGRRRGAGGGGAQDAAAQAVGLGAGLREELQLLR